MDHSLRLYQKLHYKLGLASGQLQAAPSRRGTESRREPQLWGKKAAATGEGPEGPSAAGAPAEITAPQISGSNLSAA